MSFQRRMLCDLCDEVKAPAFDPPEGVKMGRCMLCVRKHGWPDPEPLPFHRRPEEERMADPDVALFYDELAAYRERKAERDVPHRPVVVNFREFVV